MTPSGNKKEGTRNILVMTVALWVSCFVLFTVTSPIRNWLAPWAPLFFTTVSATGLAISALVYLAFRRSISLRTPARWVVLSLAVAVGSLTQSLLDHLLFEAFYGLFEPEPMRPVPLAKAVAFNVMIYVWLFGMYVAALELLRSMATIRDRESQLVQAREAAHLAQLAALRFQLNPHFLFNTLNAVSSLVISGENANAERMVAGLCDFLRSSLDADPDKPVPLAHELDAVRNYLEIEQIRFGDRLKVHIDCEEALLGVLMPGLILHPLIENAMKFAVAPTREQVVVSVAAKVHDGALVLTVEDQQPGVRDVVPAGAGHGLANVRGRLEGLYGAPGTLEAGPIDGGFRAVVRVPLNLLPPLAEVA